MFFQKLTFVQNKDSDTSQMEPQIACTNQFDKSSVF